MGLESQETIGFLDPDQNRLSICRGYQQKIKITPGKEGVKANIAFNFFFQKYHQHAQILRGGGGGTGVQDPPEKSQKSIGLLNNTGPYPLKNHKATQQAFNVGPFSARQQNTI